MSSPTSSNFYINMENSETNIYKNLLADDNKSDIDSITIKSNKNNLKKKFKENTNAYNVEKFLGSIYYYYYNGGYKSIVISQIIDVLTMMFTILFSIVIFLVIEWKNVFYCSVGKRGCSDILFNWNIRISNPIYGIILFLYMIVILIFFSSYIYKFFCDIIKFKHIRKFYNDILKIKDNEIDTVDWRFITKRLIENQMYFCDGRNLDEMEMVHLIMRRDNILIKIISSKSIPLNFIPYTKEPIITSVVESMLQLTIVNIICENMNPKNYQNTVNNLEKILQKRFKIFGILMLVLSPFLFAFMILSMFLEFGRKYRIGTSISSRKWSIYATYLFRNYNELPHIFENRIDKSIMYSNMYVESFRSKIYDKIMQFVSLITTTLFGTIAFMGFINESIMREQTILGKDMLWWLILFGIFIAIMKTLNKDIVHYKSKKNLMRKICEHTKYYPTHWNDKEHSKFVFNEFSKLYQNSIISYIYEILTIISAPIHLLTTYHKSTKNISRFIIKNLELHPIYGVFLKSSDIIDDKMEKSIVNFRKYYSN